MKTLVIHPEDKSTDFLKEIYRDKGYTVVTDRNICGSRTEITKLIKKHGRIMMMGHGYPGGLFFTCITPAMVYLLREKLCVGIWCNADKFFNKYKLRGFYTGMFCSEVDECKYNKINALQEEVTFSNELFASEFRKVESMINSINLIKESYNGESSVIKFNNARLYYRDEESVLNDKDLTDELLIL